MAIEEQKNPKLHELLAVEQERKSNAERIRGQLVETFRSNQTHFTGMRRTFKPFAVDEEKGELAGERLEAETNIVKTVPDVLNSLLEQLGQSIDIGLQIDETNTRAKADLVFEGVVLAKDVPATFLLQLEKRLREIRTVWKEIPTLDPIRLWHLDASADKKHVLRAEPVVTIRKQRTRKYKVMYEATKEHPAQIDIVEVDEPVGEIRAYDWTGMISPGKKAALLDQIDQLIEATKVARSRANSVEIDTQYKIADTLWKVLLRPLQE